MGRPKKVVEEISSLPIEEVSDVSVSTTSQTDILASLMKEIEALKSALKEEQNKKVTIVNATSEKSTNLSLNKMIKVTSLLNHTYNLCTKEYGEGGNIYTFEKYGETKPIRYKDLMEIVALYTKQFEDCYVILETKQDYEDLGLEYIYENMMTKQKLEDIVNICTNEYVDVILNLGETMQSSILSMIAQNIVNGKSYDFIAIETLKEHTELEKHITNAKEDME